VDRGTSQEPQPRDAECPEGIEAHVRSIFTKLDLTPAATDHRRVLAALAFLRSS